MLRAWATVLVDVVEIAAIAIALVNLDSVFAALRGIPVLGFLVDVPIIDLP